MDVTKNITNEEITVPTLRIVKVSDNCLININDTVIGTIYIYLLNEDNTVGDLITLTHGHGNNDITIEIPKQYVNQTVLLTYERKVEAHKEVVRCLMNWE